MTITERNQKLYELRKQLDAKRLELAWIETEIMAVNSKYDQVTNVVLLRTFRAHSQVLTDFQ